MKRKSSDLTAERLREVLHYDPESGIVTRLSSKMGKPPKPKKKNRYVSFVVDGVTYQVHALIWLYMTGAWPVALIDHKDMDRRNNCWNNLRLATKSQNGANASKKKSNKSGFKNVFKEAWSGRWKASLMVNRKMISLGRYDCPVAAHFAVIVGTAKYFGEFARAA